MGLRLRFFFGSFFALIGVSPLAAAELKVAVASNFATTARALVDEFTRYSDHQVTLLVGSSGKHAAQIQYGLAVDVFMAADSERPRLLEQKGFALVGSRRSYAQGRLVLWSAEGGFFDANSSSSRFLAEAPKEGVLEISMEGLTDIFANSEQHTVSIANPKIAPYGLAAKQVLDALNLKPRLVYGESVAQAFQFVNGGGAQLGLLALAQVKDLDSGSYRVIPEALHTPIDQQLVIINDSDAARQWQNFVLSGASQDLIQSKGYVGGHDSYLKLEAN